MFVRWESKPQHFNLRKQLPKGSYSLAEKVVQITDVTHLYQYPFCLEYTKALILYFIHILNEQNIIHTNRYRHTLAIHIPNIICGHISIHNKYYMPNTYLCMHIIHIH